MKCLASHELSERCLDIRGEVLGRQLDVTGNDSGPEHHG